MASQGGGTFLSLPTLPVSSARPQPCLLPGRDLVSGRGSGCQQSWGWSLVQPGRHMNIQPRHLWSCAGPFSGQSMWNQLGGGGWIPRTPSPLCPTHPGWSIL